MIDKFKNGKSTIFSRKLLNNKTTNLVKAEIFSQVFFIKNTQLQ